MITFRPIAVCFASATLAAAALLVSGCASAPPISARNSDAEIRGILEARIPAQSTPDEVDRVLDELQVSAKHRMNYAATESRPRVLLARLFEPGGFWVRGDDDDVEWVDVSFVFSPPPERLDRTIVFRDKLRYFHGDPIVFSHAPKRALASRPGRFPLPIPPPMDPIAEP
jgi:hypothetical protein